MRKFTSGHGVRCTVLVTLGSASSFHYKGYLGLVICELLLYLYLNAC